jgi:hypothetical protein
VHAGLRRWGVVVFGPARPGSVFLWQGCGEGLELGRLGEDF